MTRKANAFLARSSLARGHISAWVLAALLGCSSSHSGTLGASGGPFGNAGQGAQGAQGASHAGSGGTKGLTGTGPGYEECSSPGSTRECCGTGMQTCSGVVEFASWGPCLDKKGVVLRCGNDTCASNEFGHCDGGTNTPLDAGSRCAAGEFGAFCGSDGNVPPPPSLCTDRTINNEPEILAAYSPASGESVGQDGQIKVWITDEAPAIIGANEQIDPASGMIVVPGDHTSRAHDGYLYEPALYIAPDTAERGGTPHFPQYIRGWYNSVPPVAGKKPAKGTGAEGPAIEPPPAGTLLSDKFNSEDIWDVRELGLAPGTYSGEFVIMDGDLDRAVGCVTIVIAP